jgi:hypothetical protein
MGGVTASRENSGNRSLSSQASGSIAVTAASAAIPLRGDDCARCVEDRVRSLETLRSPASLVGCQVTFQPSHVEESTSSGWVDFDSHVCVMHAAEQHRGSGFKVRGTNELYVKLPAMHAGFLSVDACSGHVCRAVAWDDHRWHWTIHLHV